jgi:Holliday junction resolvasome RuvABC endonuclease subunit
MAKRALNLNLSQSDMREVVSVWADQAHEQPDLFDEPAAHEKWLAPLLGESVLGIDPSLTGFAICHHVPGRELYEGRWPSKPAKGVRERAERYERLIRGMIQAVVAYKPGLVLIEGYAYAAGAQHGHHDVIELGGVLRWELCKRTECPVIEVAPTTLKKFTTGDGKAPKPFMVSELARKHQRRFTTDDQADAFALCQLVLALTGQLPPPSTKAERTYLRALCRGYGLPEVA